MGTYAAVAAWSRPANVTDRSLISVTSCRMLSRVVSSSDTESIVVGRISPRAALIWPIRLSPVANKSEIEVAVSGSVTPVVVPVVLVASSLLTEALSVRGCVLYVGFAETSGSA